MEKLVHVSKQNCIDYIEKWQTKRTNYMEKLVHVSKQNCIDYIEKW